MIRNDETRRDYLIRREEEALGRPLTEVEKALVLAGPGYAHAVREAARRLPATATADDIIQHARFLLGRWAAANWS